MTLAGSAGDGFVLTLACAVLARATGALTTGGTIAGFAIGICVSAGFGLPGLAVLGTFFVVGTLATRVGWKTKKARGTAEAGEGRRDWKRVVGKGGVAAAVAVFAASDVQVGHHPRVLAAVAFAGAIAAALADTLGTEIGTLSRSAPRTLPMWRRVVTGTPGAVSAMGIAGAALGSALIARVARDLLFSGWDILPAVFIGLTTAGLAASLVESIGVGLGLRAPGFVRNLLTTAVGAAMAVPFTRDGLVRF